jgi:hypothetical protein
MPQVQDHLDTTNSRATDDQIDQLMYEPYGLTEEEIRVVEGKT